MNRAARTQSKLDAGWIVIGVAAAVSLFLPWPVMAVVGCIALSRYRGPNHYTKFAVPYPYRFKWDPGWIFTLCLAAFGGLGMLMSGDPTWFAIACVLVAGFIALMRVVIWLCFRFPLMSWFFLMFIVALFGIGVRFGAGRLFW